MEDAMPGIEVGGKSANFDEVNANNTDEECRIKREEYCLKNFGFLEKRR